MGYIIGYNPLVHWTWIRRIQQTWLLALAKGFLAGLAGLWIVGTPVAVALCGLAALSGAATERSGRRTSAFPVGLGAVIVLFPAGAVAATLIFLGLRSSRHPRLEAALGAIGVVPPLAIATRKADIVVLFSLAWIVFVTAKYALARPLKRKRVFQLVLVCCMVISAGTFYYLNRYVYHGFGLQVDLIRRGSADFRVVALTFDDGPTPGITSAILDILKAKEVTATFFVVGRQVEMYPDLARRIVQEGHAIGNHTYSHKNLLGLSLAGVIEEIDRAERAIFEATGVQPRYFRPPRGLYGPAVLDLMERRGYTLVLWSRSSRDWAEVSAHDVATNIVKGCRPGDILLFHDGGDLFRSTGGSRRNTVLALPIVIDRLQAQGFRFVTIREMLILKGLVTDY